MTKTSSKRVCRRSRRRTVSWRDSSMSSGRLYGSRVIGMLGDVGHCGLYIPRQWQDRHEMYIFLFLLTALSLFYAVFPFLRLLFRQWRSPLQRLPGPPSPSLFVGNLAQLHDQENTNLIQTWVDSYGDSFVYKGFVGGCRLMTVDPVAVGHILRNAYDYPKPDFVRDSLASMAAGYDGLLTVEGDVHRRQRKILSPAFSTSHVRSLAPIFFQKAEVLKQIWLAHSSGNAPVDVLFWLGRATLDVIGLAGFGHHFRSLESAADQRDLPSDELAHAFSIIFSTARKFRVITILQVWFPFLRRFRRNSATMRAAQETMRDIGEKLISQKKEAVLRDLCEEKHHETVLGKDLLSVLVRSSLLSNAEDVDPSLISSRSTTGAMSTSEILCQISTFLAAGHETTASALTWTLYALAKDHCHAVHPERSIQSRLREELRNCDTSSTFQVIESLPLFCATVRETLRVHAPVTSTMRVCMKDEDWVPTSGRNGTQPTTIHLKKHDIITIPIQAVNKNQEIWGGDAAEWRPDRHLERPELSDCVDDDNALRIPSFYANILTFLNGSRGCIGWKFALLEIKIFLYVLLKDFEFTIDPELLIEKRVNVVTRPFVKSQPDLGNQMPLFIHPVSR